MGFVKKDSLFLALSVFSLSACFRVLVLCNNVRRPNRSSASVAAAGAHTLRHTRFLTLLERDGNGGVRRLLFDAVIQYLHYKAV